MKKPFISIGIPTCYGSPSLLKVVKGLKMTFKNTPHEIIIIADSVPISPNMKSEFIKYGVLLTENAIPSSQFAKLQQAIKLSRGRYFVFTQDDVEFDKNTGTELIKAISEHPNALMFSTKFTSTKAETLMEAILDIGVKIVYRTVKSWNNGNNYLAANGRLLAFKTSFLKSINLPKKVVNGDAFFYFKTIEAKGQVVHVSRSIVYNNNPRSLKDYISQNKRFRYSHEELSQYFNFELTNYYKIPKLLLVSSTLIEAIKSPLYTSLYVGVVLLVRLRQTNKAIVSSTSWSSLSTKR